jgi:hypothetical protein
VTDGRWDNINAGPRTITVAASNSPAKVGHAVDYVANGTADQVTIKAAVDFANANGINRVYCLEGTYNFSGTLFIPNDIILEGAGDLTLFKLDDAANVIVITNSLATSGTRAGTANTNIVVRNFKVDGNKYNQTIGTDIISCVLFSTVDNIVVENLTVIDGHTAGIRTEFCTEIRVHKNKVFYSSDDTIAINKESDGAIVTDNHCFGAGRDRILYFTTGVTEIVAGNVITGATSAVTATVESVVLESGSWGSNAAGYIVLVPGTQNGQYGSTSGVFLRTIEDIEVAASVVASGVRTTKYGGPYGIEVQDTAKNIVVTNNRVEHCSKGGITSQTHDGITESSNVEFSNNIVSEFGDLLGDNAGGIGIEIIGQTTGSKFIKDNSITGNTVSCTYDHTSIKGITIKNAVSTTVTGNVFKVLGIGGLLEGVNTDIVLTGNLFQNNSGSDEGNKGLIVNGTSKNILISGNAFIDWGWKCIEFSAGSYTLDECMVVNNIFSTPAGYGTVALRFDDTDSSTASNYTNCIIGTNFYSPNLSSKSFDAGRSFLANVLPPGWTSFSDGQWTETGVTAGTTQTIAGGIPITVDTTEISTCANTNDAATLSSAIVGKTHHIRNSGAQTLRVFANTSDNINGSASQDIVAGSSATFRAVDSAKWIS